MTVSCAISWWLLSSSTQAQYTHVDLFAVTTSQGEEIAIGIRGFTHGYDFYAPRDSVVFHEYASMSSRRKKVHMFW
jgi:hypothetical protein